jgi:Xaa-Pro aminopeptidase
MAYKGEKASGQVQTIFNLTLSAREAAIKFIKQCLKKGTLPTGKEIDAVARNLILAAEYGEKFKHTLGHSIGLKHPHGRIKGLTSRNGTRLKKNIAYTIEPGIYLDNNFGVRSEIDFYIDDELNFILTTKKQNKLIIL